MVETSRSKQRIKDYYRSAAEREWNRLDKLAAGRLEFAVNMFFIGKYLPAQSRILDIGGGPGRYTIALAKAGHRVTLADISLDLLKIAHREVIEAGVETNVEAILEIACQDMSLLANEHFDAVLSLGPFYHLLAAEERDRAAQEAWRVLVPHGLIFAAWIPRPKVLKELVMDRDFNADVESILARLQKNGTVLGSLGSVRGGMTDVYCADPAEIKPFFEERGFESLTLLASEGMFAEVADRVEEMRTNNPQRFAWLWELLLNTAEEPSILGGGAHLLYIGRKIERGKT